MVRSPPRTPRNGRRSVLAVVLPSLMVCGLAILPVGAAPGARMFLATSGDPAPWGVVARIPLPGPPLTPTSDSGTGQIFTPLGSTPTIAVLSSPPNYVVQTFNTSTTSGLPVPLLTWDPSSGDLYLPEVVTGSGPSAGAENLTIVSPESDSIIGSVPLATHSFGIAGAATFDPANGDLYVPVSGNEGNLSIVSGASNTLIKTLPVGKSPITPVYDNVSRNIYVVNADSGNVTVISSSNNSIVATVTLGVPSRAVLGNPTFDYQDQELYVPVEGAGNFTVVSTTSNQVLTTITVPGGSDPVYDWQNGDLYFSEVGAGTVVVLSGSTDQVIATLAVGSAPLPPILDPGDASLYVVNGMSSSVSVISGATNRINGSISLCTGTCYTQPRPGIFAGELGTVFIPISFLTANYASYVGNYLEALGPTSSSSPAAPPILPAEIGAAVGAGLLIAGTVSFWRLRRKGKSQGADTKP